MTNLNKAYKRKEFWTLSQSKMTLLQQLRPNGNQDLPVVVDSVAWLERGVVGALLSFLR